MKAFLDIETGGFSITKNGICEIGLIAFDDDNVEVDRLHLYIKPYTRPESEELVSYKDDAMLVNGLTVDFLVVRGKSVEEVCKEINYFLDSNNIDLIIGHNVSTFDIPRVKHLLERFSIDNISTIKSIDTLKIAREKHNFKSNSLESLCDIFEIENKNKHTAIGDCLSTFEIYLKMIS